MFSTKGRYALRVMIDIAQQDSDEFIPLKDIAERQDISKKYLEIIAKEINENSKCLIYGFEQELLYKQNEDNNTFSLLVRIVTLIIILGLLLAIGIFIVPKIQAALLFMH